MPRATVRPRQRWSSTTRCSANSGCRMQLAGGRDRRRQWGGEAGLFQLGGPDASACSAAVACVLGATAQLALAALAGFEASREMAAVCRHFLLRRVSSPSASVTALEGGSPAGKSLRSLAAYEMVLASQDGLVCNDSRGPLSRSHRCTEDCSVVAGQAFPDDVNPSFRDV
jgi:hypothetical protein